MIGTYTAGKSLVPTAAAIAIPARSGQPLVSRAAAANDTAAGMTSYRCWMIRARAAVASV